MMHASPCRQKEDEKERPHALHKKKLLTKKLYIMMAYMIALDHVEI